MLGPAEAWILSHIRRTRTPIWLIPARPQDPARLSLDPVVTGLNQWCGSGDSQISDGQPICH